MCFEANAQGFKNAMDKVFAIIEYHVTNLVDQLEENETDDAKLLNEKYPTILQYYKNARAMVAEISEKIPKSCDK